VGAIISDPKIKPEINTIIDKMAIIDDESFTEICFVNCAINLLCYSWVEAI